MSEPHVQRRLVFGQDRDPGVVEEIVVGRTRDGAPTSNPCVIAFGPSPLRVTCGSCAHLYRQGGTAGTYYKCALRANTGGPATDHRVGWPACAKFEPREEAPDATTT